MSVKCDLSAAPLPVLININIANMSSMYVYVAMHLFAVRVLSIVITFHQSGVVRFIIGPGSNQLCSCYTHVCLFTHVQM